MVFLIVWIEIGKGKERVLVLFPVVRFVAVSV